MSHYTNFTTYRLLLSLTSRALKKKSISCTYNSAVHPTAICRNPVVVIRAVCQIFGASRHMGELHVPLPSELKHGHMTYFG